MEYINEVAPIKVKGLVVASYGSECHPGVGGAGRCGGGVRRVSPHGGFGPHGPCAGSMH